MKLNRKYCRILAAYIALVFTIVPICNIAHAESWGIHFLGSKTADLVINSAGVVPISGWNNLTNTTVSSGTIFSSDNLLSASWTLSGPAAANGWNSGNASDGGNSSLLDGYCDVGNGGPAIMTISGLASPAYTVYVYATGDATRPGNGGDWLPNYSANNATNCAAVLHGAFSGFIQSGTTAVNNNTYPPGLTYGNYNVFYNVTPVGGVITVSAGTDTRTWRSPFNGIELVSGFTTNPIVITQEPVSQRVVTNLATTFNVQASGTFINAQWYKVVGSVTNLIPNATNFSYTIPPVQESDTGTGYFLQLANSVTATNSSLAVVTAGHYIGPVAGFLEADQYSGFPDPTVTLKTVYPGTPYVTTNSPFKTEYLPVLNDNQDLPVNTCEQIYGWFTPNVTGNYIFFVATDDACSLWLSTNNSPTNTYQIAQNTAWMYPGDWGLTQGASLEASSGANQYGEIRSDQFELNNGNMGNNYTAGIFGAGSWVAWPGLNADGSITLTAGTPYYIELDHQQGNGGQCASVTYKLVGQPDPAYQSSTLISGGVLSTMQAVDGAVLVVTNQPVNKSVEQNTSATFKVVAGTYVIGSPAAVPPALEYQWQVMPSGSSVFTNILGAYGAAYTTPLTSLANNGDQYRVVLTTLNFQTNSSVATLAVQPDTTQPSVGEIGATPGFIYVTWNKLLDSTSALNIANYAVSGGVTVTSATMTNMSAGAYAAATVKLAISGATPGSAYKLTVNNVKDLSQLQTVAANTKVPFTVDNVYVDFNEGSQSFGTVITNVDGLASLGLNVGNNGGGAVNLQIPSGGSGSFTVNDPISGAQVNNFVLTFKMFMGPFPNNNNSNPGGYGNDFALSFGPSSEVYYGATTVGGSGINGAGVLSVTFATTEGSSGINVYYGGVLVTNVPIADNTVLVNSQWVDVTVQLNSDGTVNVDHNGTAYIQNVALPSYTPVSAGAFLFGADSGLDWQITTLDNIGILENSSVPQPVLNISQAGSNTTLSWTPAGGRLETKSALVGGSWTAVPSSQPVQLPIGGTNTFFRVVVP